MNRDLKNSQRIETARADLIERQASLYADDALRRDTGMLEIWGHE